MWKYEIHLPTKDSVGEPIEPEKIRRIREEILALFGSFTVPHRRSWKFEGGKYTEIVKVETITTGNKITKKRLKDFKESLKESLRQTDVLIISQSIQRI